MPKIGDLFGYRDIDFSDYPEFSRLYLLRGDNEAQIRRIFNYQVISWYESRLGVSTEGQGNCFIYYGPNDRYASKDWRALLEDERDLYQRFAPFGAARL